MRRLALIVPLAVLAALLVARRRRRRAAEAPLEAPPRRPALAALPQAPRFVSVPWSPVAAPEDRPELTIRCDLDEHMELDRVDAQETPSQVFLTALAAWRPPADGWLAWTREREATVRLSRPLGDRALLHAPVDEELEAPETPPSRAGS